MKINKKIILGTLVGGGLLIGAATAGIAYAAVNTTTQSSILERVAQIVGVDSTKLTDAVKQARNEQIDQMVKDGKITQTQADDMKLRVENGQGFGSRIGMRPEGRFAMMDDLATYLGVDKSEIMNSIGDEKSIKEIITSKGKTVDGAEAYLNEQIKADVDQKVKDGKLTQTQADKIIANEKTHINNFLNGVKPAFDGKMMGKRGMMGEPGL